MKSLIFFSLTLIVNVVIAQTEDIDAVKQADKLLNELISTRQTDKAAGIYSDQFVLTTSSGKVKKKDDMLKEIGSPNLSLEINETDNVEVSIEGTTAVLRGRLHQKGTINGKSFDAFLLVTDTWTNTSEGWKLLAGHASLISAPNPNSK
jgi:hypothetical protein